MSDNEQLNNATILLLILINKLKRHDKIMGRKSSSSSSLNSNPVFTGTTLFQDTQNGLGHISKFAYIRIFNFCFPVVENRKFYSCSHRSVKICFPDPRPVPKNGLEFATDKTAW